MNKICTSLEQSKKLIELGIDVNTADMYYSDVPVREWVDRTDISKGTHVVFKSQIFAIENLYNHEVDEGDTPAWSLTALLSLIKPVNDNTYTLKGTLDGGAMISFDEVTCLEYQETDTIDAVYEMVCWLKESGKM